MKKYLIFPLLLVALSCSTYNSIDNFYEAHKNDDQVTAVRVPRFMFALISGISPEMKTVVGNTKDLRYMQFPSNTDSKTQFLNHQMNSITGSSFIEVFRKNDQSKRNVIAIREKKDVVKEILVYKSDNAFGSFLYFSGNFDPNTVRKLATEKEFDNFTSGLLPQFNLQSPGIISE